VSYKNKHVVLSGSYTVEAAFVVPIIFGIIFSMIFLLFVLHDKVVLYANIKEGVVSVAENRVEYKSDKEWKQAVQKGMWMLNVDKGNVTDKGIFVRGEVSAAKKINLPLISRYISTEQRTSYNLKYMKVRPETMVRTREILQ